MFTANYCTRRQALLEPSTPVLNPEPSAAALSKEVNKLLCAAVISRSFRERLLNDPSRALEEGCNNEQFRLTASERERVLAHSAATLPEFAAGLRGTPAPRLEPERPLAPATLVANAASARAAERNPARMPYTA